MTHNNAPSRSSECECTKHELEAIISSLRSILILVDSEGKIRRWNSAAESNLGLTAEEVLGLTLDSCGVAWNEPDLRSLLAQMSRLRESSSSARAHIRFESSSGDSLVLEMSLSPILTPGQTRHSTLLVGRDVTKSQKERDVQRRLMTAVEQVHDTIMITDLGGRVVYTNPAFETATGYRREEALGAPSSMLKSGRHDKEFYTDLWETLGSGNVWRGHFTNRRKDGSLLEEDATISPVRDETGQISNYVAVKKDVTSKMALKAQLQTAQKLESIGQLAAGIAHEINTPAQFISDNTRFLSDSFSSLEPLLKLCDELSKQGGEVSDAAAYLKKIMAAGEGASLDFMLEEIPAAFEESLTGLQRVTEIVSAMKSFSHPGIDAKQSMDLNECIKTTVTISTNEWKYVSKVETKLDPELPPVDCLPGEIGQVLLNVIVNAAHAIESNSKREEGVLGIIGIETCLDGDWVEIRISDTGCGMDEDLMERIFDPFFTTKEVGRGTGQGLAIARSVVVDKHAGTMEVESAPGQGSTFIVRLPLRDPGEALKAA